MKRNLFALPNSATDGEPDGDGSASSALDTVAGLSGAFDALDNDNPQDDANTNQDDDQDNDDTQNDAPDEGEPSDGDPSNAEERSNKAFGQMRIQIKQQNQLLGKMADALGIEYSSPSELMQKLNDNALESLAQKQGVPTRLLERL